MITRFYVDNYKCLQNFEYKPRSFELLIGKNGVGKTTVFEALGCLRKLVVAGAPVEEVFPSSSLTRWQSRPLQTFELSVETEGEVLSYALEIEHDSHKKISRIRREQLRQDDRWLFSFANGDVHLFRDNFSAGPVFPADWSHSALFNVPARSDNQKLTAFRRILEQLIQVRLVPMLMESSSVSEAASPDLNLSNFSSWYRHLAQEKPEEVFALIATLREVLEGFSVMQLVTAGRDRRDFTVKMQVAPDYEGSNKTTVEFDFGELSDGQRTLIVLYTLLHCVVGKHAILCIDEPENFVSLREIQPWLLALEEKLEDDGGQALLISHHPEFINLMAPDQVILLERLHNGPTRVRPFSLDGAGVLPPAEIVARGWES